MKIQLFITLLVISCSMACKTHRKDSQTDVDKATTAKDSTAAVVDQAPDTFRVVISLISIGEGTDPEGMGKVARFLDNYEKQTGKKPVYSSQRWGREGEMDLNFMLTELNPKEQADFVEQLQKAMTGQQLILVTENKPNRFRR